MEIQDNINVEGPPDGRDAVGQMLLRVRKTLGRASKTFDANEDVILADKSNRDLLFEDLNKSYDKIGRPRLSRRDFDVAVVGKPEAEEQVVQPSVQVPTLLQPSQPTQGPSLTAVTGQQAVTPMPKPYEPFQFQNQAEIDQAAKSPVFLANPMAVEAQKGNIIMPTKEAEASFEQMSPEQQQAAIQGSSGEPYRANEAEKKKSLFQKGLESATSFAGGFNRAIAKAPSDIVKTVDIISRKLWEPVLGKTGPSTAGELAAKYEKFLDESDFAKEYIGDPNDTSLSGSVGSGFGQIATMVGGGMSARTVGGLLRSTVKADVMQGLAKNPKLLDKVFSPENAIAFGQVFNSEYEGMKAKGESDDVAFRQALANAVIAAPTENIPLANLFDRFEKSVGAPLAKRFMNGLIQGIEEGSQEVLQQTLSNLTNNQFAELETSLKDWSDGLQESRNAGGIVGLILGAISGVKGGRVRGQEPPTQLGGIPTEPQNYKRENPDGTITITEFDEANIPEQYRDRVNKKEFARTGLTSWFGGGKPAYVYEYTVSPEESNTIEDVQFEDVTDGQPTNTPEQPDMADTGTENLTPTDQGVSGGTVDETTEFVTVTDEELNAFRNGTLNDEARMNAVVGDAMAIEQGAQTLEDLPKDDNYRQMVSLTLQANDNTNAGTSQSNVDERVGDESGPTDAPVSPEVVPATDGGGTSEVLTEQPTPVPLPQVEPAQPAQQGGVDAAAEVGESLTREQAFDESSPDIETPEEAYKYNKDVKVPKLKAQIEFIQEDIDLIKAEIEKFNQDNTWLPPNQNAWFMLPQMERQLSNAKRDLKLAEEASLEDIAKEWQEPELLTPSTTTPTQPSPTPLPSSPADLQTQKPIVAGNRVAANMGGEEVAGTEVEKIGSVDSKKQSIEREPTQTTSNVASGMNAEVVSSIANRFRGNNATKITLNIKGPNGATLTSYEWANEELAPKQVHKGKVVGKAVRVSDWKEAAANAETGRSIVHKFVLQLPDGSKRTVSAESLPAALGYTSKQFEDVFPNAKNILQSIAKLKMREQSLIDYLDSVKDIEKEAETKARSEQEKQTSIEKERIANEWGKKKQEIEDLLKDAKPDLTRILQKELDKGPEIFDEFNFGEPFFQELYGKNLKELGVYRHEIRDARTDLNKTRDKIENKYKQLGEIIPETPSTTTTPSPFTAFRPKGGETVDFFNSNLDLKGDEKQPWMEDYFDATAKNILGEFNGDYARARENAKFRDASFAVSSNPIVAKIINEKVAKVKKVVQDAISKNKYQKAIQEGRMTAKDAIQIIKSTGLEVPKYIVDISSAPNSPFTAFTLKGEAGRIARSELKEKVGKKDFTDLERIHKNAEKILRSMPESFQIDCP